MTKEPVLSLDTYDVYYVIGRRGTAKSSFLEFSGEEFYKKGRLILDFWGARNFENVFWCVKKKGGKISPCYKVLLILPEYVNLIITNPDPIWKEYIKTISVNTPVEEILHRAHKEKRILIFVNSAFQYEHSYLALANLFSKVMDVNNQCGYDIFGIVREAGNLFSSLLLPCAEAKHTRARGLQLVREARHANISLGLDVHFFSEVFRGLREHNDRIIIKRSKSKMLPLELQHLPDSIKALHKRYGYNRDLMQKRPNISTMPPDAFYCVWDGDADTAESFRFPLPTFHHKRPKDRIQSMIGINFVVNEALAERMLSKKKENKKDAQIARRLLAQLLIFNRDEYGVTWKKLMLSLGMKQEYLEALSEENLDLFIRKIDDNELKRLEEVALARYREECEKIDEEKRKYGGG